jgi:ubiquinone/menaquinone biosynthesis C-methylase UbiE
MSNPHRDHSNTYTVQDRFNREELERLLIQDQLLTSLMGGVLAEQPAPTRFKRLLDIGCGPGGWLLEMAKAYPTLSLLVGVDINDKILNYARAQARTLQVADRVEFHNMDGLRPLGFPDAHFDLINERFGTSWLRTWEWPPFLRECQRLARPGGVIRVTEFNICVESSSPALVQLGEIAIQALHNSGHLFTPETDGLLKELPHLMRQYGIQDVQTHAHVLEYHAGTPLGQLCIEQWTLLFRVIEPFLQKWCLVPDNYHDIYQQMLDEMQAPDFVSVTRPLTVWGVRSSRYVPLTDRP